LLFVSNQSSNTITVFSVASNGSLALVAGSPFPNRGAGGPSGMATSQNGSLLYVANFEGNTTSVFSVASSGALTEVAGSPFPTGVGVSLTAYPPKACFQRVQIMIKPPAVPPVPINPRAHGRIPVAVLSTSTFDATTQVDRASLTFGHTGNEGSLAFCNAGGEDVDGDGTLDLVCHFITPQSGIVAGDTVAFLKGKAVSGRRIEGLEAIKTVPH
jgi:hypothetical protein